MAEYHIMKLNKLRTEGFSERNLIGMGAYGSIYKALINGSNVAVKVFNLQIEGAFGSFDIECEVLRTLHHPDSKALFLEYMPTGILETWLYFLDFTWFFCIE